MAEQSKAKREKPSSKQTKKPEPDPSFLEAVRRAQGQTRISQLHLAGENHSWRGVRIRDLSTPERRQVENDAAKLVGEEGSLMQLRNETLSQALFRMVVEVTKEPVQSLGNGEQWVRTPLASLAIPGEWDRLFTARDTQALERIYNKRHEMSPTEVDLLAGKLLPVATED
jgi:hypothetical protein